MFRRLLILCCLSLVVTLSLAQENAIPDDLSPITDANASQLAPLFALDTPLDAITMLTWSPDGRFIVVGGVGGIILYNTDDLSFFAIVEDIPLILGGGVAFSPNAETMVSAGRDYLRVWDDMTTGAEINRYPTDYPPGMMRFSPDGSILAVTADTQTPSDAPINGGVVYLWDIVTGQEYGVVGYPYSWVGRTGNTAFRFAYDSLWTVSGTLIHAWDPRQPESARDPLLLTRSAYLDRLNTTNYIPPDAPRYLWTPFRDSTGLYGLWLENDTETLFITEGGDLQTMAMDDPIPEQIDDFTRLDRAERAQALIALAEIAFPLGDEMLMIVNRREAGVAMPRYVLEGDTLTDQSDGTIYTAVEDGDAGRFESVDGEPPGSLRVSYSVGETPPADTVLDLETTRAYLSGDGTVLARSLEQDDGVTFENLDDGTVSFVPLDPVTVDGMTFSADNTLAIIDTGNTDFLVDVVTGAILFQFEDTSTAFFSPDCAVIVTQSFGRLTFWAIPGESM